MQNEEGKVQVNEPRENSKETCQSDNLESILNKLKAVDSQLKLLEKKFDKKIANDLSKKEAFDKLYEEMRLYKDNFLHKAIRPILVDILLLYDNVSKIKVDKSIPINNIKDQILEILYRQDVEPIESDEKKINRKLQRAVKTIPTDVEEENGYIVELVRDGFYHGDHILRLQEVICKKYQK